MKNQKVAMLIDRVRAAIVEKDELAAYDALHEISRFNGFKNIDRQFVNDDKIEIETKDRLEYKGILGVQALVENYNGKYNIHFINDYGNINDSNLFQEFLNSIEEIG
ncbi:hypothetical protein vBOeSunk162_39 [Oenococcus phage vB_OeS_unk162]|nr:hypothetical protein vBOeSunk162_39 [Oenococcus phage vB_OeS_unk162]QNO11552.1 hypothetical protein [Oenococcus phage Vinitor-27]